MTRYIYGGSYCAGTSPESVPIINHVFKPVKTVTIEEWDALHALIRKQNVKIEEQARLIAKLMERVEELEKLMKARDEIIDKLSKQLESRVD
jgi:hypothetical protein